MDTLFSGHYFQHKLVYLAFSSLQLADTINNFEVILTVREGEYKKKLVKCFFNVSYIRYLEILYCSSFLPFLTF